MESLFHSIVSSLAAQPEESFFEEFLKKVDLHFDSLQSSSLAEQRKQNKSQLKGIFFELVCYKLCLQNAFTFLPQLSHVCMFSDLPNEYRSGLSLRNQDMGIDIVAITANGEWLAIQCKYRRQPKRKSIIVSDSNSGASKRINLRWAVPWADLSTFYSLVERTGPPGRGWDKAVVMTNALSVNRQGRKTSKDISICHGSFRNVPKDKWLAAVGYQGHTLGSSESNGIAESLDLDLIRAKRLAALDRS